MRISAGLYRQRQRMVATVAMPAAAVTARALGRVRAGVMMCRIMGTIVSHAFSLVILNRQSAGHRHGESAADDKPKEEPTHSCPKTTPVLFKQAENTQTQEQLRWRF